MYVCSNVLLSFNCSEVNIKLHVLSFLNISKAGCLPLFITAYVL